jgi:hypothetical protein
LSINIKVGESLIYKIPNRFSNSANFKITDPNGNEFFNNAVNLPQGQVLSLEKMNIPGIYTIFDEKGEYVAQIAANLDESESQLTGLDKDKLSNILDERIIETPISIIDNVQDLSAGITRVRTGTELWQIFILLALLCAISEMIVARVTRSEVAPA